MASQAPGFVSTFGSSNPDPPPGRTDLLVWYRWEKTMFKANRAASPAAWAYLVVAASLATPIGLAAAGPQVDGEASRILQASTAYLAGVQQFSLVTHSTIEAVLESGQKIQFDSDSAAAVQRPNRLYAARLGDLVDQEFFYDGKTLTLHDIDSGYFATVEAPDTLEGMLDFARDSLDITAPAGDLLYSNAYELLMEGVQSGFVVGEAVIEGVLCDQLAFSKPGIDFQIWIARGDQPLPLKMVVTSRDVLSAPQFTVLIREWEIEAEISPETFVFDKPENAEAIEFIVLDAEAN